MSPPPAAAMAGRLLLLPCLPAALLLGVVGLELFGAAGLRSQCNDNMGFYLAAAANLLEMLPPEAAVVPVTLVTETVAIVGAAAPEVRLIWAP